MDYLLTLQWLEPQLPNKMPFAEWSIKKPADTQEVLPMLKDVHHHHFEHILEMFKHWYIWSIDRLMT